MKDLDIAMAGVLNNATGALGGGILAAQQAQYNNSIVGVSIGAGMGTRQVVGDLDYRSDGSVWAFDGSAFQEVYRANEAAFHQQAFAAPVPPAPAPHVETVERLPRVIELEAEGE